MKVFVTTSFNGHYPVGTAAVTVAETAEQAYEQFVELLRNEGLWEAQTVNFKQEFNISDLTELDISKPNSMMLNNGNY